MHLAPGPYFDLTNAMQEALVRRIVETSLWPGHAGPFAATTLLLLTCHDTDPAACVFPGTLVFTLHCHIGCEWP